MSGGMECSLLKYVQNYLAYHLHHHHHHHHHHYYYYYYYYYYWECHFVMMYNPSKNPRTFSRFPEFHALYLWPEIVLLLVSQVYLLLHEDSTHLGQTKRSALNQRRASSNNFLGQECKFLAKWSYKWIENRLNWKGENVFIRQRKKRHWKGLLNGTGNTG